MLSKPTSIIYLRDKFIRLMQRPVNAIPSPILTAAGLLLLSVVLVLAVVSGLRQKSLEEPVKIVMPPKPVVLRAPPAEIPRTTSGSTNSSPAVSPSVSYSLPEMPLWPLTAGNILVSFGWQEHPVYKDWRYHGGIDISALEGQPVQAMLSGVVQDVYRDKNNGLTVTVADNKGLTYYGSLAGTKVSKNSIVKIGDKIGTVGACTAEPYPHLHLAIKRDGKVIDPQTILRPR